jgi:hypothetical protein
MAEKKTTQQPEKKQPQVKIDYSDLFKRRKAKDTKPTGRGTRDSYYNGTSR